MKHEMKMKHKNFLQEYKIEIIITLFILVIGSFLYFNYAEDRLMTSGYKVYENMQIKATYTEENNLKLFAAADEKALKVYNAKEGNNIPKQGLMIVGFEEARMMREEKLFTNIGDNLADLFGVNVNVYGVLDKTDSILDDMHFLEKTDFDRINGEEGIVYIKLNEEKMPKTFYYQQIGNVSNLGVALAEGSFEDYQISEINGETYYPLIVGYKEAMMMKEEKLFSKTGDTIKDLFGKNFVVVGVLEQTNTSIDMMHIVPLTNEELN